MSDTKNITPLVYVTLLFYKIIQTTWTETFMPNLAPTRQENVFVCDTQATDKIFHIYVRQPKCQWFVFSTRASFYKPTDRMESTPAGSTLCQLNMVWLMRLYVAIPFPLKNTYLVRAACSERQGGKIICIAHSFFQTLRRRKSWIRRYLLVWLQVLCLQVVQKHKQTVRTSEVYFGIFGDLHTVCSVLGYNANST